MLSDFACEIKESDVFRPVIVVHHLCLVGRIALEVKEF